MATLLFEEKHPDGSHEVVRTDGPGQAARWVLTLPDGQQTAGETVDLRTALHAMRNIRRNYIFGRWCEGRMGTGNTYVVPLFGGR